MAPLLRVKVEGKVTTIISLAARAVATVKEMSTSPTAAANSDSGSTLVAVRTGGVMVEAETEVFSSMRVALLV